MTHKTFFLIVLPSIFLLLTSCASNPEKLGINDLEWESYSQERQKTLLANYDKITKERETLIPNEDQEPEQKNHDLITLTINIHGGKIMFPPSFINWQDYKPLQFTIGYGQCLDVEVFNPIDEDIKTMLGVCLHKDVLYLDASRYDTAKTLGSINIPRSPLWQNGFSYKGISSNGYVHLNNVTVEIKQNLEPLVVAQ